MTWCDSFIMRWLHRLGAPPHFVAFSRGLVPWLAVPAVLLTGFGVYAGLVWAPADYQQGDAFRIIYLHVPSAWMSLFVYTAMAVAGAIALIWRLKLAEVFVVTAAPLGASFTFLALVTGSIWGKPMWGTWWVWDARLTSELILLFLYLGIIALNSAIEQPRTAARACSLLVLVGVINIPIIHYSVEWWNTLHQGPTITRLDKPAIDWSMLWPLLSVALGFTLLFGWLVLIRMRAELLWRERGSRWVQRYLNGAGDDA
jgi:heme exporter protein C